MLSEELKSISAALEPLLGRVRADDAQLVRICRRNLAAAAEQAEHLEAIMDCNVDAAMRLTDRPPLAREMGGY
ncbi:hypothetical protein [Desulfovibrio sp. ZJ200]|uniref:hypothetical protein n=1 Tax=Desulfovibrio sp. ZJ200 TaxID=2709792 RepID=UPI0013E9CE80|nr:hypothetical protein [Desulfovibrio sp. ZJ200]